MEIRIEATTNEAASATARIAPGTRAREAGEELRPYSETCRVANYEDVEVPAGKFAAFRIDCETNDGFAEHWYAPEVKNLVGVADPTRADYGFGLGLAVQTTPGIVSIRFVSSNCER